MQFLIKLSKSFTLGSIIIYCTGFAASCQNTQPDPIQANIINTNATAMVFAPGVVSTQDEEWSACFTPDGNTVYFSLINNSRTICFSKMVDGKWFKPKTTSFSGQWKDWDPFISPDGKRIYFVSNRPLEGTIPDTVRRKSHLWYADHLTDDNWSAPHYISEPFNLDGNFNYAPSVSSSGTLFFYSPLRDKDNKKGTSYYAKWLDDHYDDPKELSINGDTEAQDPFIAPDESYLIFVRGNDIYISFRRGNDWSEAQKLGPQVNNGNSNSGPYVSLDGKMLYYSSDRSETQPVLNGKSHMLMIPINIPKAAH